VPARNPGPLAEDQAGLMKTEVRRASTFGRAGTLRRFGAPATGDVSVRQRPTSPRDDNREGDRREEHTLAHRRRATVVGLLGSSVGGDNKIASRRPPCCFEARGDSIGVACPAMELADCGKPGAHRTLAKLRCLAVCAPGHALPVEDAGHRRRRRRLRTSSVVVSFHESTPSLLGPRCDSRHGTAASIATPLLASRAGYGEVPARDVLACRA
jgi:hypothetical protein